MKQGNFITKITMLVLFLAVLAYLGGAAWKSFRDPYPTLLCYGSTADDSAEATGLLLREETVIPGAGGIVDVLLDEGEKVGAGQAVAVVYRDQAAFARKRELRALELQANQLNCAVLQGGTGWDSKRLDEEIADAMVGLKYSAATGDLTGLEDQCLSLKSLVLSREAAQQGGAEATATRIAAASAQLSALQSAASRDTTAITVPTPGVFSAVADGYEAIFTPAVLPELTPASLDALAARSPAPPADAVGKLITSSKWYFAAKLPEAVAARLIEGRTVTVRFSRDWSGEVTMKVERISAPQHGLCAVTLSSTSFLSDTTLLRKQTVELVFSSTRGIRVPKIALRSETRRETDAQGAVTREYKLSGVYVLTGAQAEFRPVEILYDDGDYFLVKSPASAGKRSLRSGDEVIVASQALFDGKVVR